MNNYLQNDMPGLNGLLEKHKQMQERSAIKSQPQMLPTIPNVTSPANPMLQPPNGLYHMGTPAMLPYTNGYIVGNPIIQCQSSYFNPTSVLQPANNYFNTNPMLQPSNNYFSPGSMLQAPPNNYFDPNHMMHNPTSYFAPNPVSQFPVPPNYFNQNLIPQYDNSYFNPNPMPQFQNDAFIHDSVTQNARNNYAQNLVLQYINGNYNSNPVSQCNQNSVSISVNSNSNMSQNVNNSLNQSHVNSCDLSNYYDSKHHIPKNNISAVPKGKVYLNPRYKNTLACVDPQTVTNSHTQNQEQIPSNTVQDNQTSVPGKHKVHVNPKYMTKLTTVSSARSSSCSSTTNVCSENYSVDKNTVVSSSPKTLQENNNANKLETNVNNSGASKENDNSSILILTKRKLIRVKKNSKTDTCSVNFMKPVLAPRRRLLSTGLKKLKISPKKMSNLNQLYDTSKLKYINSSVKNALGHSLGLISIDGVLYNKSRNQLIRSNSSVVKRKRDSASNTSVEYYVAEDGKKLLKLDIVKKKSDISLAKLNASVGPVKNYKTNVSNKVKQRSLQILRDKMRKNNQPCLLFKKFGYCSNLLKGTCSKVHDKKLVAVCRKFLQGKCLLNNCPLSHDVGPEKMPTCKYFLEGFCTREGCPYLHVKVSSKKPICKEFLRGYCPRGNECPNRHVIACPEFDKNGSCSKGKFCPYPHKSLLLETKRSKGSARRKSEASASSRVLKRKSQQPVKQPDAAESLVEGTKRYYDESSEDLSEKRDRLLKQVASAKDILRASARNSAQPSEPPSTEQADFTADELRDESGDDAREREEKTELGCNKPRRPPIGPLPAYIPIE